MQRIRIHRVGTLMLLALAPLLVHCGNPFDVKTELNEQEMPSAIGILKDHIDRVRSKFITDPSDIKLINSPLEFVTGVLSTWEKSLALCAIPLERVDLKIQCFQNNIEDIAEKAHDQKKIDTITFKNLLRLRDILDISPDGKIGFNPERSKKYSEPNNKYSTLPQITTYLRTMNNLTKARELARVALVSKDHPELRLASPDETVFSKTDKLYEREISKIGDVTLQEYVLATYNSVQVQYMADLLVETLQMITAQDGRVVLSQEDPKEIQQLIDEKDAQLEEIQKQIDATSDVSEQKKLIDQYFQVQSEIKQIEKRRDDGTKSIELAPSDIYRFTVRYLNSRLVHETRSQSGRLYGVPAPKYADLMMAAYLTGKLDAEVLSGILDLPEFQEYYPSFWEQVGGIALGAARIAGPLVPGYGIYISMSFVIFDSIRGVDNYEKANSEESYLIR